MSCPHGERAGDVHLVHVVRHGQSTSNVAYLAVETSAASSAVIPDDDMAIELTDLGWRQAGSVGRWLAGLEPGDTPDMVWCSPYLRAEQTWRGIERELASAGRERPCHRVDERLRDRDRGRLRHRHPRWVREWFPAEIVAEERDPLGYRPPDGESFRDVAERLREVVAEIEADGHRRVLIVAHDAVVLFLRQILEGLSDEEVLAIAAEGLADNGSITSWQGTEGGYRLLAYNVSPGGDGYEQAASHS
ncbi:histidine phosphatase family protein [Acrocarpospora macrocephala]|uniref:Phosphoglycerate mutase n=1 Tax=Acrocarpospora macrocephala TaxID=150177 RepID=A0A5M3WC62_9ACTN|nr:histidine phosphatase family protein [Acrocarpospora macrocephala]GES06647.1 phosphoglycerate mutase [Acrocarpospora macrocephala]